jgi:hypothetical protein
VDGLEIFQTLGGAAGAVGLVSWFGRLEQATKANDREAIAEYEDAWTWVNDSLQEEGDALRRVTDELNARNLLYSGEYGHQMRRTRDAFAQRWRDRKRASDRLIEELCAEPVTHRLWRKLRRRSFPMSPHAEELANRTRAWDDEQVRGEAARNDVLAVNPNAPF